MNQNELDLLHGYLDGTTTDADFALLQTLLRESAEARRMLRDLATVDAKLQELAAVNPATLELLAAAMPFDRKPWSKAVAPRRKLVTELATNSSKAVWRRPHFRWASTGVVAAALLIAFFIAGNRHGQFNVLAAVVKTQKTVQLPRLRQYSVVLSYADGKSNSRPLLENVTLRSRGTERFIFQATRQGRSANDMRVLAGRDERGYWAYVDPIPFSFRSQSWPKFDEALPDFKLLYMELGPIIAALSTDFDIADRGAESLSGEGGTKLRHLQGTLKPEHRGAIQLLDFWIDSESEIARLEVLVPGGPGGTVRISFKREASDFKGEEVYQPAHYCPAGIPEVDVENSPLRSWLNKLNR